MDAKALFLVVLLIFLSACNQMSSKDPEFFGANFSFSSCVKNAGNVDALESFMTEGMMIKKQLSPDLSKHFLGDSDGKAWSFASPHGNYAVAYRNDGICTVFIKETNVSKYISHMNQIIKHLSENSNWVFSTSNIPMFAGDNQLKKFEFSVALPEKKVRIFISSVNKSTGNYQVAFSTTLL